MAAGLGRRRCQAARQAADTLPARLTDQEFWRLSQDFSEPNGNFRSDNLVSNEIWLQWVIPELLARSRQGSVYLGVGPEQNFTYIAALKPKMVFITDVRRGNLHMHLMYKALFELTTNRADFVALLFNKKRPAGLTDKSSAGRSVERVLERADASGGGVQGESEADSGPPDEDAQAAARQRPTWTGSSTSTGASTGTARPSTTARRRRTTVAAAAAATWRATAT